ncbi:hypothetical protein AB0E59_42520 [Lentzea sp. NPDC034063]|uniref:hypothetical protein n=1 Tax=unclassified Lentzea TaxID=2643253 RepID=UPI0033E52EC0
MKATRLKKISSITSLAILLLSVAFTPTASAASCREKFYTQFYTKMCGTKEVTNHYGVAEHAGAWNVVERYYIAPNKEIWHIWVEAFGKEIVKSRNLEMPGDGRADNIVEAYGSLEARRLVVNVYGSGHWCTEYRAYQNTGYWNGWRKC